MADGIKDVFLRPAHFQERIERLLCNGLWLKDTADGVGSEGLVAGIEGDGGNVGDGCIELVLCVLSGEEKVRVVSFAKSIMFPVGCMETKKGEEIGLDVRVADDSYDIGDEGFKLIGIDVAEKFHLGRDSAVDGFDTAEDFFQTVSLSGVGGDHEHVGLLSGHELDQSV